MGPFRDNPTLLTSLLGVVAAICALLALRLRGAGERREIVRRTWVLSIGCGVAVWAWEAAGRVILSWGAGLALPNPVLVVLVVMIALAVMRAGTRDGVVALAAGAGALVFAQVIVDFMRWMGESDIWWTAWGVVPVMAAMVCGAGALVVAARATPDT